MDVLIASQGRPQYLESTLRGLLEAASAQDVGRIVVVENGALNGVRSICDRLGKDGKIHYEYVSKANKSVALNHGLKACSDGLIFLTDDDVEVGPNLIPAYLKAAGNRQAGAYYAGPTEAVYEFEPDPSLLPVLPGSARGWSLPSEAFGEDDLALGHNWAAFKSDLIEVGGFNPDYGPGSSTGATGQESEMQRRLKAKGIHGVYVRDALVGHRVPGDRCNYDWLMKRARNHGLELGIYYADTGLKEYKQLLLLQYRQWLFLGFKALSQPVRWRRSLFRYKRILIRGIKEGRQIQKRGELLKPPFLDL